MKKIQTLFIKPGEKALMAELYPIPEAFRNCVGDPFEGFPFRIGNRCFQGITNANGKRLGLKFNCFCEEEPLAGNLLVSRLNLVTQQNDSLTQEELRYLSLYFNSQLPVWEQRVREFGAWGLDLGLPLDNRRKK